MQIILRKDKKKTRVFNVNNSYKTSYYDYNCGYEESHNATIQVSYNSYNQLVLRVGETGNDLLVVLGNDETNKVINFVKNIKQDRNKTVNINISNCYVSKEDSDDIPF